jgi:hypothetical protein
MKIIVIRYRNLYLISLYGIIELVSGILYLKEWAWDMCKVYKYKLITLYKVPEQGKRESDKMYGYTKDC